MAGNPRRILQVPGPAALTEPGRCRRGRSGGARRARSARLGTPCAPGPSQAGALHERTSPRAADSGSSGGWGSWLQLRGSSGNRGAGGPLDFFAPCRSPRSPGPRAHSHVRALVRELRAAFVGTLPFRSCSWRPPEVCFPLEKSTRQREGQRAAGRPEGRRSASLSQFWGLETIT